MTRPTLPDRAAAPELGALRRRARILLIITAGFVVVVVANVVRGHICWAGGMCYKGGFWYAWELLAAVPTGMGGIAMWLRARQVAVAQGQEEEVGALLRGKPITGFGVAGRTAVGVILLLFLHMFAHFEVSHPGIERAYQAAMRSDLDRLRDLQDRHDVESGGFALDLAALGFAPSAGVGIEVAPTADGYTAVARHEATDLTCALFVGSTARPPATEPGVAECESLRRRR